MGGVCAKNEAGTVTSDQPRAPIKRENKELMSSQANLPKVETKFIKAGLDFNLDKGVEIKADDLAKQTAEQWCKDNEGGWTYTGTWKNERDEANHKEVSLFEVSRPEQPKPADEEKKNEAPKEEGKEAKKEGVIDQKQSFVDQVKEGLEKKVPPERFADGESGKKTPPKAEDSKEAAPAADEEAKEDGVPEVEEEKKSEPAAEEEEKKDEEKPAEEEKKDDEEKPAEEAKDDEEKPAEAEKPAEEEKKDEAKSPKEEAKKSEADEDVAVGLGSPE